MTILDTPKIILGTFTGLSTDVKPTFTGGGLPVNIGTKFVETDTGRNYIFDGTDWVEQSPTAESTNFNALQPRSSFISLFGDTFAVRAANSLYLLEDVTGIGADLTNNGGIDLTRVEDDLPLRGFKVPTLNGTDQFFSTPTAVANQVGVGGFVASVWFKTSVIDGVGQTLFAYGDTGASEQTWRIEINTSDTLTATVDDGTNVANAIDPSPERWQDGIWHVATMLWDPSLTPSKLSLYVDGELLVTDTNNNVGTLDNAGTELKIGARNISPSRFFNGQESNFQLYIADAGDATVPPDYNIPALMVAGLRESASILDATSSFATDTGARINNRYIFGGGDGNYVTTVINTSEGIYDLLFLFAGTNNAGIIDFDIDGITYQTTDGFNASTTFNQKDSTSGIFLSAGTHILKLRLDGKNAGSSSFFVTLQMLELIKRDGENQGDDESSSGILFFDEFDRRSSALQGVEVPESTNIYNNQVQSATPALGDFAEGDFFIKQGTYKITYTNVTFDTNGLLDIFFGGVKVFDQLDTNGSLDRNTQFTRTVFLEGGKTTIKHIISGDGGTSDFATFFISLRWELVTGKSNGDDVVAWGVDILDWQVVQGADPFLSPTATVRFNGEGISGTPRAVGDQFLINRYFSGGTYKVEIATKDNDTIGGVMDVGVNNSTNNLFVGIALSGGSSLDVKNLTTIDIPRGFHDISFLIQASGAGERLSFQWIKFSKIATVISTEDDNSDPIGRQQFGITETTTVLDFNGGSLETISIAANTTFTGVNYDDGVTKTVRIKTDGTLRTLAFPPGWVFVGAKPTDQAANKTGILTLNSYSGNESDVIAAYSVEA